MAIEILHISDFHFRKGDSAPFDLIEPMVAAVHADHAVGALLLVAVTGDIANSGIKTEYEEAERFFGALDEKLSQAGLAERHWAYVPGNHDCDFSIETAARQGMLKAIGSGNAWDESVADVCTPIQAEFFAFAKRSRNLLAFNTGGLIAHASIDPKFPDLTIWGINSAWMSQKKEQPGNIWFPIQALQQQIDGCGPGVHVLLLHHPFAWFSVQVRRELSRLSDTNFVLVLAGHEHLPESWARDDLQRGRSFYVEGGSLQPKSNSREGSAFNLVRLDLDGAKIESASFAFESGKYEPRPAKTACFDLARQNTKPARRVSDKCTRFLRSAGATFSHPSKSGPLELPDIYVEPELLDVDVVQSARQLEQYTTTEAMLRNIKAQPYIVVGGAEKAGKSAWLRWVYMQLHAQGLTPVRIEGHLIRSPDEKRLKKLLSDEYQQQYDGEADVVWWEQLDFHSRALLIDDFDVSPLSGAARKQLLATLTLQFSCVLITCDDALLMQASGANSEFDGFQKYEMPEFGHRLRDALISKWIRIGRDSNFDYPAFQLVREQRAQALNLVLGV